MLRGQRTLKAQSILQRYAAGERDFRGLNLKGLSFRQKILSGADFTGADLRCTDFTQAQLVGCRFADSRLGRTWRSSGFVWACCLALAAFAVNEALRVDAEYELENIFLIPIQLLRSFLAAEAIAYLALCATFILKSPRTQWRQTTGIAIAITLIGFLSIGITASFSGLMATCVAISLCSFLIGLWLIALSLRYSQAGINLFWIGFCFVFAKLTGLAAWSYLNQLSVSDGLAMAFARLAYPVFRIGGCGFLVGYFFTAAISTLWLNLQRSRAVTVGGLATLIGTVLLFLLSVWLDLKPFKAVTEFVVLSVGCAGLIAAGILATYLSAPGGLAKGRLHWLYQGVTSFQHANLTRADLSGLGQPDVNWSGAKLKQAYLAGTEIVPHPVRSQFALLKPFKGWIWPMVVVLNLLPVTFALSSLSLNVSSRSPLPPQQVLELLRSSASLYRVIPFGFEPVQSEDITSDRLHEMDRGERVQAIALSPDGKTLAAGGKDEIKLWDVESGEFIQSLRGYPVFPRSLQFTADGKYLRSKGDSEHHTKVTVWELATGQITSQVDDVKYLVDEIAIEIDKEPTSAAEPDEPSWKVGQKEPDWRVRSIDLRTGKTVARFPALKQLYTDLGGYYHLQFLANQNVLLNFSGLGEVSDYAVYWDFQTGEQLGVFEPGGRNRMQASSDGQYFAVYRQPECSEQASSEPKQSGILKPSSSKIQAKSSLEIWDLQTQSLIQTFDAWSDLKGLIWSEDSQSLIGYNAEAFQVWDLEHRQTFSFSTLIQTPIDPDPPKFRTLIDVSHDGEVIATAPQHENAALIWKRPQP